jgi:hypothetical protein
MSGNEPSRIMDAARIKRLWGLIAQLEQAPPSKQRDALLRIARERVVALDTGVHNSSTWGWRSMTSHDTGVGLHHKFR